VVDGETGPLTKSADFDGLMGAMRGLVALPADQKRIMSKAANARAASQFDLEDVTRTYMDIVT